MEKTNYTKENLEFLTVAAETCKFFEQVEQNSPKEFLAIATKLLPLLYYKTVVVPVPTTISDEETERIVSEVDYEHIRNRIADLLGEKDYFLDTMDAEMQFSDTPLAATISENLADVYQNLKDYVFCCQIGNDEVMNDALANCLAEFGNYWGDRLLAALRALHQLYYSKDEALDNNDTDTFSEW